MKYAILLLTIGLNFYSDPCNPAKCPHLLKALGALHPAENVNYEINKFIEIMFCGVIFHLFYSNYLFVK